ncbi:MAG: hypothetical protein M0Z69_01450 [Actinomycetota bacterium]|nr:hypothetical protein [Actinomycetota bacterium]
MTNNRSSAAGQAAEIEHRHRLARPSPPGPEPGSEPGRGEHTVTVRGQLRLGGGEAGRALAAAQGRALAALLACLGMVEVGQGEEVSP